MRETHEGPSPILLRVLTHTARSHHPSAAASPWRSVALGAERAIVPSECVGAIALSVPNALRHFSIQENGLARLPRCLLAEKPWNRTLGSLEGAAAIFLVPRSP